MRDELLVLEELLIITSLFTLVIQKQYNTNGSQVCKLGKLLVKYAFQWPWIFTIYGEKSSVIEIPPGCCNVLKQTLFLSEKGL